MVIPFNLGVGTVATLRTIVQAAITTEGGLGDGSLSMVHDIYRTAFQFS